MMMNGAKEILAKAEELIEQAGGDELIPAIEAGLVTIDPLIRDSATEDEDAFFNAYVDRLRDLLRDGHAYPLFDEQVAELVRQGIAESTFELRAVSARRGKQVSAAAHFMEGLPAFPLASVGEILSIRLELQSPLVRFRSAVIEMERLIESAAHEPDFTAEVEELYMQKVAPALLEIGELAADNRYLRQLAGAAVADLKTMLMAAGITVGVTLRADVPGLVAAALDLGIPTAVVTAKAAWQHSETQRVGQRHQLFFLYKTNELLSR